MLAAVETPYRILFLSGGDSPEWFTGLCRQLSYEQVTPKRLSGSIRTVLQKLQADAIIAPYEHAFAKTFRSIFEALALPHRPLLVFILSDDVSNAPADLLLPPFRSAIQQSVNMALRQRADHLALLHGHETLHGELDQANQRHVQQQQTMDELNLLKNAIVRNVSHELKTPLLQVKAAVALMAEENETSNISGYATEAVARLEAVIKNITQLADGLETRLAPVLVNDVVDQVLRGLRRSWEHKNKLDRIHLSLERNLPPVMADRNGLGIVLNQLLDNALKFSEERVELRARRSNSYIAFAIRDYGIGIPKENADKIFDTFFQVDNTTTRRFGGTGVGLAIVRLILDRHHARIKVESEEGRGSTFSFELPIADIRSTPRKQS
jgi:signal transduction histidine kinase